MFFKFFFKRLQIAILFEEANQLQGTKNKVCWLLYVGRALLNVYADKTYLG